MTDANKKYLVNKSERGKRNVGPTHVRDRLVHRILGALNDARPEEIEEAKQMLKEKTITGLYNLIEQLLDQGTIEPSGLLYTRVEEPVLEDMDLSPQATALYTILAHYTYWPKRTCWPSLDTLAKRFGTSRRHIIKWRDELVDRGHITYTPGKGRAPNQYHLVHRIELAEAEKARTEARVRNRIVKRDQGNQAKQWDEWVVV